MNNNKNGSFINDVAKGLRYSHVRINANTSKTLETASFLYALIEILHEKGLLAIEELDERKKKIAERLVKKFTDSGIGLLYQDPEYNKYKFEKEACVDCLSRLSTCKAICCKLPFPLSKQDVEEGIIRWEFSQPYLIAHDKAGYCVHLDRKNFQCTVRENRPVPCRGFDCSKNEKWKIWKNFNNKIIEKEIFAEVEKIEINYGTSSHS